jgi:hypothetical protein
MQERGARKDAPSDRPPDKAQRNFTDGDSRIMPSQGGFIAGCNGQIAVDAAHQIITAHRLSTNPADFAALVPLIDQTRTNLMTGGLSGYPFLPIRAGCVQSP